jgi:hypothetical protein
MVDALLSKDRYARPTVQAVAKLCRSLATR